MDITTQLAGLVNFGLYFTISISFLLIFKYVYALATPHDEWKLIKEEKNTAAALTFGSAVLGFAIALGGAASNSVSIIDYAVWAIVALIAQLIAFFIIRLIFMPKIVSRIENNEISAGITLSAMSISVGILNAACMTY